MHTIRITILLSLLRALGASGQAPAGHDHPTDIPGLKKEMFTGITADDLLKLGEIGRAHV